MTELVFGRVRQPEWIDATVDVKRRNQSMACRGYDNLGFRPLVPKFLVVHRAQNPPEGSNEGYFDQTCCPALTDLEVNCLTGVAKRFVGRGDAPSGWANGVVSAPYGDALAFLKYYGWDLNQVNRDGEACEISGYFAQPGTPVTREDPLEPVAKRWLAQWFAWRADQYKIPWQDFPIIKAEGGRSYITWHKEWTIGTGKICPGKTVCDATPEIIELARAIMKAAQEGAKPEPAPTPAPEKQYPKPVGLPFTLGVDWGWHELNGSPVFLYVAEVEALKPVMPRAWAGSTAPKSGDTIPTRTRFLIYGDCVTPDKRRWLFLKDGSRIQARHVTPSVIVRKR